jgi:hypothetical protein
VKKLLLPCIAVVTFAAFNVWSQAVAEPSPLLGPGVVVTELRPSAKAVFLEGNANNHGGPDGR